MAKRFTDTEKWKDAWFCSLSEKEKLFWIYLVDNCDHAGIWRVNWPLVKFYITDFDFKPEVFNGRIVYLSKEKWFISKFVDFQYDRELNPENRTHLSVIKLLEKEKIDYSQFKRNYFKKLDHHISENRKKKLYEKDNFKCVYCGDNFKEELLVIDHIIPRSQGGDNTDNNLITSCKECNLKKGEMFLDGFIKKYNLNEIEIKGKISALRGYLGAYRGAIQAPKDTGTDKGLNIDKDINTNKDINNTKELLNYFYSRFKDIFNKEYIANFGKDGKIIKDLLVKIPIDELKRLIDIYLATPDKFVEDGGYSVGIFKSRINSLRIEKKTGKISEKTIKSAIALKSWMEKKDA